MKHTRLFILLATIMLLMDSCQKEHTVSGKLLEGKIKQIIYVSDNPIGNVRYNFYYDSVSLLLERIYRNDTLQYIYSKRNPNLITIKYINFADTGFYYAHLNADNNILAYNNYEDYTQAMNYPYSAKYQDILLDTLLQEDVLYTPFGGGCVPTFYHQYTNVKCFGLHFVDDNCVTVHFSYTNKSVDPCNPTFDTGRITLTYTDIDNINNQLPVQEIFIGFGDSHLIYDNYFLKLLGCNFGKKNKKLLKSTSYHFIQSVLNEYNYEMNDKYQVNKILIKSVVGSSVRNTTADIQYY